jgi:hypothetical protein
VLPRPLPLSLLAFLIPVITATRVAADDVLLVVRDAPADGLVVARVDLTGAAAWCKLGPVAPQGITAVSADGASPIPFQFVPDAEFDPQKHVAGTVILRLPGAAETCVRLRFAPAGASPSAEKPWDGAVKTPSYEVKHDAKRQAGFPCPIVFAGTKKAFEAVRWNDRLHHRERGSFALAGDPEAQVERLAAGPLCTVVRVRAHYVQGTKRPDAQPEAVYDWYYFSDRPLVYVAATIRQQKPQVWHESHFLEMTTPESDFLHWAGGEPHQQGELTGAVTSFALANWGAMVEGRDAIGMLACGQVLIYDNLKGHGSYLQAHGDAAWREWSDARQQRSAWLWIGSGDQPVGAIRAAAQGALPTSARASIAVEGVRRKIDAARTALAGLGGGARRRAVWNLAAAERLAAEGRFAAAAEALGGKLPADWRFLCAGDLGLTFQQSDGGVRLASLYDAAAQRELAAAAAMPLFTVMVRHSETKEMVKLAADAGWTSVDISAKEGAMADLDIRWRKPKDARLGELRVVARAVPDPQRAAVRWTLDVQDVPAPWGVWQVAFPQVAAADLGPGAATLVPRGCGEVQRDVAGRGFRFQGTYPSGWTAMQFAATYAADGKTGLYAAVHDPLAGTKEIVVEGQPSDRAVAIAYQHPAENMGLPGTGFRLEGEAVWQLLHGDWFDAAVIYRDWVRGHARWYPPLGPDGRGDTPLWMRELSVWLLGGGAAGECENAMAAFAKDVGIPVGFHWYSWHQIPFDNDYPHYFPTKPGFAEAVGRLQATGVSVMPYINGRLWDTRDRGMEDFEFTKVARPAATKNEQGEPYVESYGSKEGDGKPVRLAAMCPTTPTWQNKVREIVLRLMNECGTRGVYIDQIAAAQPTLCFDRAHGHPLGGGHWWTEGYWRLLDALRRQMPKDRMITTECNGEPYIRWFDGYLTWHWQYDGQVPAFPAVYGGSIQMFGRAYRGGPTKDLALRMKAGQQLVYGEQIGWFGPDVIHEKPGGDFVRAVIALRWQLRRYFYAGEMARPPRLTGPIPRVTADWQWSGVWPVTTDAVMAGAWRLPREKRIVLLFANVGDQPVKARVEFDAAEYGLAGTLRVARLPAGGQGAQGAQFDSPAAISREVEFPPRQTWAWELTAP